MSCLRMGWRFCSENFWTIWLRQANCFGSYTWVSFLRGSLVSQDTLRLFLAFWRLTVQRQSGKYAHLDRSMRQGSKALSFVSQSQCLIQSDYSFGGQTDLAGQDYACIDCELSYFLTSTTRAYFTYVVWVIGKLRSSQCRCKISSVPYQAYCLSDCRLILEF